MQFLLFPVTLFGIEFYKKSIINNSNFLKKIQQQTKKTTLDGTKTDVFSKETIKHVPVGLKRRLEILQSFYQSSFLLDHSVATVFGTLAYAMNHTITLRLCLLYPIFYFGNMILQMTAIKTGKQLYDYSKYQYFNKLFLCVIMGVFTITSVKRVQYALRTKDIILR